jgi:4-hydroxybenzoate polyprenyltransferase
MTEAGLRASPEAEGREGHKATPSDYARLVRIEHAVFSFPMFIAGALVAGVENMPGWIEWVYIVIAGTAARSLALALNRLIDHRHDAANPRTQNRELPAGLLSRSQVSWFILANLIAYLTAAWLIAPTCLYLSWVPLLVFAAYPFMKRFTALCHFGVGAGLALAPIGGYLAAAKVWPPSWEAWLLAAFTWLWVAGFDIIYAQLDFDFDLAHGVRSLPVALGRKALIVAAVLHGAAFVVLGILWVTAFEQEPWAALPIAALGVLFYLQHRWAHHVNLAAFRLNMAVGFVMLAFVIVGTFV